MTQYKPHLTDRKSEWYRKQLTNKEYEDLGGKFHILLFVTCQVIFIISYQFLFQLFFQAFEAFVLKEIEKYYNFYMCWLQFDGANINCKL